MLLIDQRPGLVPRYPHDCGRSNKVDKILADKKCGANYWGTKKSKVSRRSRIVADSEFCSLSETANTICYRLYLLLSLLLEELITLHMHKYIFCLRYICSIQLKNFTL